MCINHLHTYITSFLYFSWIYILPFGDVAHTIALLLFKCGLDCGSSKRVFISATIIYLEVARF